MGGEGGNWVSWLCFMVGAGWGECVGGCWFGGHLGVNMWGVWGVGEWMWGCWGCVGSWLLGFSCLW